METATATATKKNVKRFLQCRLRYSYRFAARGEQHKVQGVLEEVKNSEGTVLRMLPAVELPKKEGLASVTIGPLNDEQIERLEGNPGRNQAADPMFKHLRETGRVRWLHAKPSEDKSDREKLEDARKENAELRAELDNLRKGRPMSATPEEKRSEVLQAARSRQAQGLPLSAQDRELLGLPDEGASKTSQAFGFPGTGQP